ncbi:CsxC family protein [Guptibacillus hwajinpoensis]|uniref:DUF7852 domain-containing protein n=1 Tax=Guptibacillus hwajinpoensis TaxID=208199 RepID=A0A0J6CY23_9BACL|nr:hypothetical protein [Alkalihalobacillus macyae]KMM36944.1 hypothetical protein AB986_13620 [Alkalihalobacillus macyae]
MGFKPIRRSASTNFCDNTTNNPPVPAPGSPDYIKVPVVLGQYNIQIPMHAEIDFPEGQNVLEIKDIKKRAYLTQCKLISVARDPEGGDTVTTGKLYISGFVRKNIKYAANPRVVSGEFDTQLSSNIRSLTVPVPFDCVTEVTFQGNASPVGPFLNQRAEWEYLISQDLPSGFPEKDELLGTDLSQFHQQSTQYFNELPFCELNRAEFLQIDESLNRVPISASSDGDVLGEGTFTQLSEKMVLDLTLTLLQKQTVVRR